MPVEMEMEQKFPEQKIKPFEANRIAAVMADITTGKHSRHFFRSLTNRIALALNVSAVKVGRMVNNIDQPTTPQLATIAQLLDVSPNDLIQLEEGTVKS